MTVFMTRDGEPFFCGTYFPRDQFRQLVLNVSRAWQSQRGDVTDRAKQIAAALAENALATAQALRARTAASELRFRRGSGGGGGGARPRYDAAAAGSAARPKFPPSMVL